MAYFYDKQCKSCGNIYSHKEITKEMLDAVSDRLAWSMNGDDETVTIQSMCSGCAEEYYKNS